MHDEHMPLRLYERPQAGPRTRLVKHGAAFAEGGEAELSMPMNGVDCNGIGMSPGHVRSAKHRMEPYSYRRWTRPAPGAMACRGDGCFDDLPAPFVDAAGNAHYPVLAPRLKPKDARRRSLMIDAGGDRHADEPGH